MFTEDGRPIEENKRIIKEAIALHQYSTERIHAWGIINCELRKSELRIGNDITGNVFILAGDELQILVFRDGTWRFVNET